MEAKLVILDGPYEGTIKRAAEAVTSFFVTYPLEGKVIKLEYQRVLGKSAARFEAKGYYPYRLKKPFKQFKAAVVKANYEKLSAEERELVRQMRKLVVGRTIIDKLICPRCGEDVHYECDLTTGRVVRIRECKCGRFEEDAKSFLKARGLYEEFLEYRNAREAERKEDGNADLR